MPLCIECLEVEVPTKKHKYCSMLCLFWANVAQEEDGCWLWTGPVNKGGYGEIIHRTLKQRDYAHRYSYRLKHGSIPQKSGQKRSTCVGHSCGNKLCVNPEHLMLGRRFYGCNKRRSLTMEQAREIRNLYQKGVRGKGQSVLAKRFDVLPATIYQIVNNITYLDV